MSEVNIYIIHRVLYVSAVWCLHIPSHDREDSNYSFFFVLLWVSCSRGNLEHGPLPSASCVGITNLHDHPGKNVAFLNKNKLFQSWHWEENCCVGKNWILHVPRFVFP